MKKVVIIDDIMTTGSSIRESIPILLEHGLEIVGIICIVDRSETGISSVKVNDITYPIHSLFTLGELQDCQRNPIN